MLVHPEISAWLNRQSKSRTGLEEKKAKPLVTRTNRINKGGMEKASNTQPYAGEEDERPEEVEYLNERKSSLNFYA